MSKTISLAGLLLFLAAVGGVCFYKFLPLTVPLLLLLPSLAVLSCRRWRCISPAGRTALPLLAAVSLAAALHPGPVAVSRLALALAAWTALVSAWRIERERLRQALSWLAWLIFPLAFMQIDNANILAVWPVVSALAGGPLWLCGLLLLYLGSRGALIGLAAGLLVRYGRNWRWLAALPVVGLLLAAWRPATTAYRLDYWQAALTAWQSSPWVGVGPGGLWAGHWITEPGGNWQLHAHNAALTWLAETGLIGLLFVAFAIYDLRFTICDLRFERWQLAIFAALAAWSLVDEPLFWPGPLLLAALIVGCQDKKCIT